MSNINLVILSGTVTAIKCHQTGRSTIVSCLINFTILRFKLTFNQDFFKFYRLAIFGTSCLEYREYIQSENRL